MEDVHLIFGWSPHEECGGWSDFQAVSNSLEAAKQFIRDSLRPKEIYPHGYCWQVVELKKFKLVYEE